MLLRQACCVWLTEGRTCVRPSSVAVATRWDWRCEYESTSTPSPPVLPGWCLHAGTKSSCSSYRENIFAGLSYWSLVYIYWHCPYAQQGLWNGTVCLSVPALALHQETRYCRFAAVGPVGWGYWSITARTHTFNGPFSGTTHVSWYQKGNVKPIWISLKQETVASAGPYGSLHFAPDR